MEKNSLKNEVIRAQDVLNQIHMRFAAEYKLNTNILGEIRSYKEKLKRMEDERIESLIEIEKHLSVIAKTNEELQQRLINEENVLHDADENTNTTEKQQLHQADAKNIAEFTDALTLQLGDNLSKEIEAVTPHSGSNLEIYLQNLYEELCIRVQAQQNQLNTTKPGTELLEIKALLDEGQKRLKMLSVKMENKVTEDSTTTTTPTTANKNTNGQVLDNHSIQDEHLKTGDVVPLSISSPKPEQVKDQKTEVQVNSRPPPVQDGWVKDTQTSTPTQNPEKLSFLSGDKFIKEPNEPPLNEDSQNISSAFWRPIGPVRASNFGVQTDMTADLEGRQLGSGRDYFEEMFQNAQEYFSHSHDNRIGRSHVSKPTTPPLINGYNAITSSAIGNLCILEINEDGKFVRIYNSNRKETEIGNYIIKQNVGGHPVIVFRFPPRTKFPQNSIITVWTASCDDDIFHDPPSNYIWDSQVKWGVGPEFTTILCKPNGQAIAWTNAAHRYNPHLSPQIPMTPVHIRTMKRVPAASSQVETRSCSRNEIAFEVRKSSHSWDKNLIFLERKKKRTVIPASCTKYPYGQSPGSSTHPSGGKDTNWPEGLKSPESVNSTRMVITKRCSSSNANGGHAANQPNIYTSSKNKNNSNKKHTKKPEIDLMSRVAFMKPSTRLQYGLELIQAQYDMTYNPPMPKLSRAAW